MVAREPGRVQQDPRYANKVGNYVPTRGRAGYADDLVSSAGTLGLEHINSGFCDEEAFIALNRLVSGPLEKYRDLQSAEAALQALMFFDHIALLTPAWGRLCPDGKYRYERPKLAGDVRPFEHELLSQDLSDQILICEYVSTDKHDSLVVTSSTLRDSGVIERKLPSNVDEYLAMPKIAGLHAAYPAAYGLPAYFANPLIQEFFEERGTFATKLYKTFEKNVLEAGRVVPGSEIEVRLPIFVWELLGRVDNRSEIPAAIIEMRAELNDSRRELAELEKRMRNCTKQAERVEVARYYTEAFDKIVDAFGQNNFSYVRHLIFRSIEAATAGIPTHVMRWFNPQWKPSHPKSYVNRSVAAKSFLEFANLENANHIVETLDFSSYERALIARGPNA